MGTVKAVLRHMVESGWCLLSVIPEDLKAWESSLNEYGEIRCVGTTALKPAEGLQYTLEGAIRHSPKYGRQFAFTQITQHLPSDVVGIERYLASGAIKGVGPVVARALVAAYGERTFDILNELDTQRLTCVNGIGPAKAASIRDAWSQQGKYNELMVKLMALGLTPGLCTKVIKHFEKEGQDPLAGVQGDPYCLTELWGVGFRTADRIGRQVGVGLLDPRRLRAAAVYCLQQARDPGGDCYLPQGRLAAEMATVCDLTEAKCAEYLERDAEGDMGFVRMVEVERRGDGGNRNGGNGGAATGTAATGEASEADPRRRDGNGNGGSTGPLRGPVAPGNGGPAEARPLRTAGNGIGPRDYWLAGVYHQETEAARRLGVLADAKRIERELMAEGELQRVFHKENGYELTAEQLLGAYQCVRARLAVLTGGPGTGKTTITRAIVRLAEEAGVDVCLASPTGRAAKRLEELTGHEAMTLHRLLKWSPEGHKFLHGPDNPLECGLVVVDESSMLDISLMYALAGAIDARHCQLILVGDRDQLPSVGPGAVLQDIIASGRAVVCELTQIMRQARDSGIISDAHRINRGKLPALETADCMFVPAAEFTPDDPKAGEAVARGARDWLLGQATAAAAMGKELQILTPMRRGPLGTEALNNVLQEALNPPAPGKAEVVVGHELHRRTYRVGDRVLQTRNDYDRQVMNGDVGVITAVDSAEDAVTIAFADTTAVYSRKDLGEVELAYAMTVHKSQGSEYPDVVVVCVWAHWTMLTRTLLYTALTRARERVTVVGEERAIERAVKNNQAAGRNTRLRERLGRSAGA